jgi:hypothetical protein
VDDAATREVVVDFLDRQNDYQSTAAGLPCYFDA